MNCGRIGVSARTRTGVWQQKASPNGGRLEGASFFLFNIYTNNDINYQENDKKRVKSLVRS